MIKKPILTGGLIGFFVFVLFFIILSINNTGKVSICDAFCFNQGTGYEKGLSLINYALVIIFILIGTFFGWFYKKIKSKKK